MLRKVAAAMVCDDREGPPRRAPMGQDISALSGLLENGERRLQRSAPGVMLDGTTNFMSTQTIESEKRSADSLQGLVREIGERILTQDNRITSNPIFVVQTLKRDYGFDPAWTNGDGIVWIHDGDEYAINSPRGRAMEKKYAAGEVEPPDWSRVAYRDRWEFVTACFTEQGCKDYILANGHNLKTPRIFVESGHRNEEWKLVREYLSNSD